MRAAAREALHRGPRCAPDVVTGGFGEAFRSEGFCELTEVGRVGLDGKGLEPAFNAKVARVLAQKLLVFRNGHGLHGMSIGGRGRE